MRVPAPGLASPGHGVAIQAAADPAGVAVLDAGGRAWTWAWVSARADALAAGLAARGAGRGTRVAAGLDPTADGLALVVAAERAGTCLVPVPGGLTARERSEVLAEIEPAILVAGDGGIALADLGAGGGRAAPEAVAWPDPAAAALGILTSGTTGRPKVALLSRSALLASAAAWTAALPPATGWLLALGLGHVAGLGVAWRAWGAGLPIVIAPAGDPLAIAAALGRSPRPSHVSLVPTQLARLLATVPGGRAPASVRAVPLGGAAAPGDLVARAVRSGWPVFATYGLTEAGSGVTALAPEEAAAHPGSAGRPLPGVEVRIARPGPDGVGEVEVLSAASFSGYLGRPAEAASSFTGDDWLRTGDLGLVDAEGRLLVADRREDLIVSGGENVRPAEVEAVLAGHPSIADAGVVGRPDAGWGAVVTAVLVLNTGASDPGDDALRAYCRERLAPWKVPAAFVRSAGLPRTTGGKLRRADLRALVADRAPAPGPRP